MNNMANKYGGKELEFAIFCIENIAIRLNVNAQKVYSAIAEKSDILYGYIMPEYETLHTQSKEYIINDILEVMNERGVEVLYYIMVLIWK